MHETTSKLASWNVGPEYDGPHKPRLLRALTELGYSRESNSLAVVGSQEIASSIWVGSRGRLSIESETYVGLVVAGQESEILELRNVYERSVA
jgi:hypothetical protein